MNKTVILVGHSTFSNACSDMFATAKELKEKCNIHSKLSCLPGSKRYILDTKNCSVYFVNPMTYLSGISADAVFGDESFKGVLRLYCKLDANLNPTMNLVAYISHIELCHECIMFPDKPEETKTCTKSKEDWDKEIERAKRIVINSCYGICGDYNLEPIYLTMARGGGKNWHSEQFRKFMEQLDKEPVIKPLSKKDEETVEYCRKDVEMTSFLYKEFNLPKMETIRFNMPKTELPEIKNVIFNDPATIVIWADGTKTVVQCQDGDIYDPEKGLAMAISKKIMGNKRDYYHTFKHWLKRYKKPEEVREFEFTMKPGDFKFDPLAGLALGKGEFTFHFDNDKEDK